MNAKEKLLVKYFAGTQTDSEYKQLLEYYDADSLKQLMAATDQLEVDHVDAETLLSKINLQAKKPKGINWAKIGLFLAVALLGILAIYLTQTDIEEITNDTQRPMPIALLDGSTVELAPSATISYNSKDFSKNRKIILDGHAFFDVEKGGAFLVKTDEATIEVLGTSFDVWEVDDETVVKCYSGKVLVKNNTSNKTTLTAGMKAIAQRSGVQTLNFTGEKPPWLTNELQFENVPLESVYKELEAFYGVQFEGILENSDFSGILPTNDLNSALGILDAVTPFTYQSKDQKVLVQKD